MQVQRLPPASAVGMKTNPTRRLYVVNGTPPEHEGKEQQHGSRSSSVTYSSYSPTPSSIAAHRSKLHRVSQWTNAVPPADPKLRSAPGSSVGAISAAWSDSGDPPRSVRISGRGRGAASQLGAEQVKSKPPRRSATSRSSATPLPSRAPPTPVLAQSQDPSGTKPEYEHLARADHPLRPLGQKYYSEHSAREAYLNDALQLPLDMIAEVASLAPSHDDANASARSPSPKKGRLDSVLGRVRSTSNLNGAGDSRIKPSGHGVSSFAKYQASLQTVTPPSGPAAARHTSPQHPTPAFTSRNDAPKEARAPITPHGAVAIPPRTHSMRHTNSPTKLKKHPSPSVSRGNSKGHIPRTEAVRSQGLLTPPASDDNHGTVMATMTIPSEQLTRRASSRQLSIHLAPAPPSPHTQLAKANALLESMVNDFEDSKVDLSRSRSASQLSVAQITKEAAGSRESLAPPVPEKTTMQSTASIESFHDSGDHVTLKIPQRRGKLQVSFSWLSPRKGKDEQQIPDTRPAKQVAPQHLPRSLQVKPTPSLSRSATVSAPQQTPRREAPRQEVPRVAQDDLLQVPHNQPGIRTLGSPRSVSAPSASRSTSSAARRQQELQREREEVPQRPTSAQPPPPLPQVPPPMPGLPMSGQYYPQPQGLAQGGMPIQGYPQTYAQGQANGLQPQQPLLPSQLLPQATGQPTAHVQGQAQSFAPQQPPPQGMGHPQPQAVALQMHPRMSQLYTQANYYPPHMNSASPRPPSQQPMLPSVAHQLMLQQQMFGNQPPIPPMPPLPNGYNQRGVSYPATQRPGRNRSTSMPVPSQHQTQTQNTIWRKVWPFKRERVVSQTKPSHRSSHPRADPRIGTAPAPILQRTVSGAPAPRDGHAAAKAQKRMQKAARRDERSKRKGK